MLAVAGIGDHPPPGSCGFCFQLMLYSWKESMHNPGTLAWQQHRGLFPTAPSSLCVCLQGTGCAAQPFTQGKDPGAPLFPAKPPACSALSQQHLSLPKLYPGNRDATRSPNKSSSMQGAESAQAMLCNAVCCMPSLRAVETAVTHSLDWGQSLSLVWMWVVLLPTFCR